MLDEFNKLKKMLEYLDKIKVELVMSNYHDGWSVKWLNEKKVELETEIETRTIKHNLDD